MLCGRYDVRAVVGVGGMGEVRDGWDTLLDRPVAIKLLHPALAARPDLRRRFHLEARAAARLSHPNIVAVYDFGEHDGVPFIAMERLPGATLAGRIASGPLPGHEVRRILVSITAALATAHAGGVLHRDIKPGNILLTEGGDVKVADFGLAKMPQAAQTQTGQIMGTMAYMSPERLAGAPASVADDVYATGVLGYECLAGHRPFVADEDNMAALAGAILHGTPRPLRALRPTVEPALAAVVERAMDRDPRTRFSSAHALHTALAAPHPPTKVLAGPPLTGVGRRRHRAAAIFAAVTTLLVLGIVALALASDPAPARSPQQVTTSTTLSPPPPPPSATPEPITPSVTAGGGDAEPAQGGGPPPGKGPKKHRGQ